MSQPAAHPHSAPRRLTVLGSTGSIGTHTLALLRQHPTRFQVGVLTAQNNVELLIEQAREFRPQLAVIGNDAHFAQLKEGLSGTGIETAAGCDAIEQAAMRPTDMVIAGIVGAAGLKPVLNAIRTGTTVAIANKEPLVCAGSLIMREVQRHGATLLPVDSEHNAIFQVFAFDQPETVRAITLTASGGPFRGLTLDQMRDVTPEQAVAHPNWSMGAKISVDSATMINKGLEMIEAYHLFPLAPEQIGAVIHPQSVVHGLVHYYDGSVLAQLGPSDMTVPIAHALAWPGRIETGVTPLSLTEIATLEFEEPDLTRFPGLKLAQQVLRNGGSAPIYFNAVNEVAVERFLQRKIGFLDIADTIARCLDQDLPAEPQTLDDIIATDAEARHRAETELKG